MFIKVHRPTRVLLDAGLHDVAISRAEALRLFRLGVTEEHPVQAEPEKKPEADPVPEKKPAKKRSRKKKAEE